MHQPLRGEAEIGMRVGKVINHYKVGKHFQTEITSESFSFRRDEAKIAAEAALDGLYIVRSNVEPEVFDADQTVRAYKGLSKVERAFRCMKSVDLKVRPIHHRRADRVRAHVLLCMLAYYVEWHMRSIAGAAAVRRSRSRRRRAAAYLGGGTGAAIGGCGGQGVEQARRRWVAGAQLSDADQRSGHADGEHDAGRRGRQHVHAANAADARSAALFRAAWGHAPHVAMQATLKNRETTVTIRTSEHFAPGTSA